MTYKTAKNKLDEVFSKFIRNRDCQDDWFTCISCGKIKSIKQADAGHYYGRAILAVRWDEKNVNAQCRHCNRFQDGNKQGYTIGLIKKYGPDIIDLLAAKSQAKAKYSAFELQLLIKEYE